MYTLRILTKIKREDGTESSHTENFDLGSNYSVYDQFSDEAKEVLENSTEKAKDELRFVLRGEKGPTFLIKKRDYGINSEYKYYIVGENGQTLESLNRV